MGHWDEHLALQTFLNEAVLAADQSWLNSDLLAFIMGIAQHEMYDLLVNERPVNVQRIDFQNVNSLKAEMPTIYLNLVGIGVSLWKTLKIYSVEQDKDRLRKRLLGLLGAVTPDILEGIRLALQPDPLKTWNEEGADKFHLPHPEDWRYPVDTFQDMDRDLQRRRLIQGLTVSLELFNISF